MERVDLRMTPAQARKLMRGGVVQFKPDALRDGVHWLALEKKTANRVRRAQRAGKGCRIQLSPLEMEHSGEGIASFFKNVYKGAKKGAAWLKKNVIDTEEYQKYVRPLVRKGVDAAMAMAAPTLGPGAKPASDMVNKFGAYSGAYGLREDFAKVKNLYTKHVKKYVAPHLRKAVQSASQSAVRKAKKIAPKYSSEIDRLQEEYGERAISELGRRTGAFGLRKGRGLQNDNSNFLNPKHPAMRPIAPHLPPIGGFSYLLGGSFMPSGGSFKVSGY